VTLQPDDFPDRWLTTNTNSTKSPWYNLIPSVTSDVWKNSFLPPSTSWVKKPNNPEKIKYLTFLVAT